jgi:cell division protein ZapA (FtsZ GTPase activity inhibitor)
MSVQISIAGRTYPINVKPEAEDSLKRIAAEIESHMKYLRDNYAIKDSQDILAMTLLEYANRLESSKQEAGEEIGTKMLEEVETLLNDLR